MKKRILSILLLCCMMLTLLPTTVSAADGPMNTIPKFDVSIDVYNRTSDISIKDSRSYYIYSSVPDKLRDTWAWDKKIFIQGDKAAPHVFIDGVNIKMSPSSKGPAIELNKKASAYLYFIGRDSTLQGADGRAAIQKNRSEGQLYVLARTGTTVTCKGGYRAAGIGGSWAIRNIGDSMFNMDMYGHGVNMHFGSQSNSDYWGGTINATGGEYGAGIGAGSWGHSGYSGNTIHGGAGERLYFYSGTVNASGGRLAAGIGGGFRGRGSHIYIYGGNIDAQGGDTGAGIGGGSWTTKQDMDGINAASDIVISGGRVSARGQYNCAGIGGGQYVPARNITITGGHVSATGHYGAAIGGGRWCRGKNITITDATLNLSSLYRFTNSSASAIGFGDIVYDTEELVTDPSIATNDQIRIGSYKGKLVQLKLEARALSRDDEYSYFWNLYETLIPDENGLIDMQLLTLPYVQNYGWAINVLEMTVIDDPCNGNHDFGWVNRQSCHVWACRNKDCQARDPAAEMSKQNGKHIPGDWGIQEKHCAVCDHLLEKDTAAPVLEVLKDGESYTVEDNIDGNPGAYTFTVSDPAASGETSSGIKSVTINGEPQDGPTYCLPAPDGGNNDAGAEYTVVATDNAGNASTATVKIYRRHRVRVVSPDEQTTYAEAELAHNEYLVLTMKMPDGAAVRMTDKADHSEIPYDKEMGRFTVGLIDRSRTLVLEYNTEYPKAELILGRSQYFFGYNADTAEPHYLADVSKKTDKNVYSVAVQIKADVIPSHYFSSPVCYTQEELAELDKQGKIAWEKYQHPEPQPGVWIVYIPTATIDIAEYDANGSWYVYAKAENLKGTTYVSTPKLIADVEKPKAINLSTGKELETDGEYWGDLRFRVEDALPVKVWHERYPGGNIELMTPDEDGCYTIPADYDVTLHHDICIEDACGNKTYYNDIDILWNYLEVVREKDYWDVQPAQPIRISREQDLQEELSKVNIGVFASDVTGFIPVDVSWEIPEDYDPQSPREQTFTVLGTVILEGTGARCVSGLDVITRPGEEWKKNFAIGVTVEGAPRYKVTTEDSANGSVTVVNATETTEDGTPLFYKDELVMLSIAPDEGYMLSTLSVNGTAAAVAVGEDAYTFAQPEENVTITATFEKRNEHTVTFDANGGSEPKDLPEEVTTAMPAKKVLHGSEYCLPECEFIAPEGKQFKAWQIGDSEYAVNDPVTVTADITVKALWEDAPPAPVEYTVTVTTEGNGTASSSPAKAVAGAEITLTATPNEGYRFKEWQVISGGVAIKDDKFIMPSANVEVKAIFKDMSKEQFTLAPGGTYYFDLSAMGIPGTVNGSLPDASLHYVPFTYAGTMDAYKLMSTTATTEEYAQREKYPHSLFVADYAVTHTVSWDDLNTAGLIFGKDYAAGGVGYTLRAPSCGSGFTDSGDSERGTPQSNEWDAVLNKNSGYIQNWNQMYSWGQDAYFGNASDPAVRGYYSARTWSLDSAAFSTPNVGFRPVLEILNPDALGSDGLKVVTLDLGGGTLGGSSEDIQIIVKTGSEFTAPASGGLTRPDGNTGSYFMWLGSDGKLYAPGTSVPADVTKLTAQFALSEQFSLAPGGRYYFDLSAMNIPGTANGDLPDSTLHYVPFTYAGTVNAYKLTSEMATTEEHAQQYKYDHSLFIADYNVTFNVDWNQLNEKQMIFGTPYTSYGVNYTMRAPSAGSQSNNGKDDSSTRGIPKSNEWDAILDKANQDWKDNTSGYIKNWSGKYSFGQDNYANASRRAFRGYYSARFWTSSTATFSSPIVGFRPVLEILNADTLGPDGLKVVTLDLNGGKLGNSSEDIQIIVKTGSEFTAPASDGLNRPDGDTGSYFMWLGSNGKLYAPGASVPADVTTLTVQWTAPTYTVTLNTNGGTINNGNVTGYTYGVGATLPTDVTRTGYTFKGWYDNEGLTGDPVTAIGDTETGNKEYWAKWEINQYTITVKPENGKADITITQDYGTPITAPTLTREDYQFNGWDKAFPTTMPAENLTITAQWRYNGGGGSGYSYYTIKATAGAGGSISPSGNVSVREGRDQTFTITPDKGYAVANVKIDGKSIGAVKSYTFENVRRTHTIEVIFMKANGNPQTGVFVDVATGSYYEDAVDWAVENGITTGVNANRFDPNGVCTRAQAVTFLWRAAGSPAPRSRTMPFTDVPVGSYYYDAVLWAVENGITKGTSETMFSPDATCSRAQIVAFLWRSEKSPAAGSRNPFADVKSTAYYADAVLWAVKEDITKGTTNTTFSPDADCTRAQIVTFLWRCKK